MDMLRIAMLGVTGVFLALLLKTHKPEFSVFLSLSLCVFIFLFAMDKMTLMISYIRQLQSSIALEGEYVSTILKMIGITYLAEFASNICKDAGYGAIAGQLEIFAKLSILALSMPILLAFIRTVGEFLCEEDGDGWFLCRLLRPFSGWG